MSRTATATPPPPLFHQKNATPSARHSSKGHLASNGPACSSSFRHFKRQSRAHHATTNTSPLKDVAPMSASDMLGIATSRTATPDPMSSSRTGSIFCPDDSDTRSIATSVPSMSSGTSVSSESFAPSIVTPAVTPSSSVYDSGELIAIASSNPSMASLPSATPSPRSWVNGFGKMARAVGGGIFRSRREGESPKMSASSPATGPSPGPGLSPLAFTGMSPYIAPSPASMAPSVPASPAAFSLTPAPLAEKELDPPLPLHVLPPAVAHPYNMPPALPYDSPVDNPAEALRRAEWAEEQHRQVTEFARLCSQWPHSSYNQAKWGPNGGPTSYVPQSWANPPLVISTMQRQSKLENDLCDKKATFFVATRSTRSSSTSGDSEPSSYSFVSSQVSTATSLSVVTTNSDQQDPLCAAVWEVTKKRAFTTEEVIKATERKTADDLRAAMASPMVDAWRGDASIISVSSTTSVASVSSVIDDKDESKSTSAWASLASSTRSLSELDHIAQLATTDLMDIDEPALASSILASIPSIPGSHPASPSVTTPSSTAEARNESLATARARSQSCPAKRPLTLVADDSDKRPKVDEPMVLDNVVLTEEPAALPSMFASVPNLVVQQQQTMMQTTTLFGHVVKTSHSNPLIISPFIPLEIISTLGKYLVLPTHPGPDSGIPLQLASDLDVPLLLLSCPPPSQCAAEAGPVGAPGPERPKSLVFNPNRPRTGSRRPTQLGNLMLSSCPGKRLRMDGPVKGRGPVCRDLGIDLRRIKDQGCDAIVCCLDDEELALLGVPWDNYRDLASEIGLDIIRLPMPDGFTPVSLPMFDAQVSLIVERYTLRGQNVLVHCRGGIGRAGLTACAWAIKMGFVQPHPSLAAYAEKQTTAPTATKSARKSKSSRNHQHMTPVNPMDEENAITMSMVERAIAMIRSRRGLKAIESMEQVRFLAQYVSWLRESAALEPLPPQL